MNTEKEVAPKREVPMREYAIWLRDQKSIVDMKLGLLRAESAEKARDWAVKRHRAMLKKLECADYRIEVTDLLLEKTSRWSLPTLLQPGAIR